MARDIDYAAIAVRKSIVEKFGRQNPLEDLEVSAGEKTIHVIHGAHRSEGTRDNLLADVRQAGNYEQLWEVWDRRVRPSTQQVQP